MSKIELLAKIELLNKYEAMIEEMKNEADTIRNSIKAEMEAREVEELIAGQYISRWTSVLSNRGGVKVYPVWQGGGTVKVVIIDQGWRSPGETELADLQAQIDPGKRGEGYGIAPIGHRVTAEGVTEMPCNITLGLTLAEGAVRETVLEEIRKRFEAYLEELRKNWADSTHLTVRISYLESRALETDGVVDVFDCRINGGSGNLILGENEVPVLGEIGVTA